MLGAAAAAGVCYKAVCQGRSGRRLARHVDGYVAAALVVVTFLYLYETSTLLDVRAGWAGARRMGRER